jgi:hypothetical protein
MRTFACVCGNTLFFENAGCIACGREVGWCPACGNLNALLPQDDGAYRCGNPLCAAPLLKCVNYAQQNVCNRCVAVQPGGAAAALCDCCRFNETIPDLSVRGNREKWARLEAAKRRLFYTLDLLRLPRGRAEDGFDPPLAFDFKADVIPAAGVWRTMGTAERAYTGHAGGKITINIREADDVERERLRVDLGEAHRTVIGHFRHEIGHYYWDVLVRGRHEDDFRRAFGDPGNPPYQEAIERYYRDGPPPDWQARHVSAYAAMHPWEDWAETFAFYLDMVSVLDTASNMAVAAPVPLEDLQSMIDRYRRLGVVVNEMNRDMGLKDLVPEVLTPGAIEKLAFVDRLVRGAGSGGA